MRIAVRRETAPGETRVALTPDLAARLVRAGHDVAVEPACGTAALFADDAYAQAGAEVTGAALEGAGLVLSVQAVPTSDLRTSAPGVATLSFFATRDRDEEVLARQEADVLTYAMELVPRISRAQPMDALSSQALVTGYRGAVVAAGRLRQFFPLSMTAAGTVRPAEVLVLGAGVAGLQAIATCKRLGAVVKGFDVRPAASEEIASMGAQPLDLGLPPLEGAGGYARVMDEDRARLQRELLAPHVAAADALITTAAVPGQRAPVLVTADMVAAMKPGSVVVDLAADTGGNVEGVVAGQAVAVGSVQLWGGSNVASQMPNPASRLYAQNVWHVISLMGTGDAFDVGAGEEILTAMRVTAGGAVTHGPTRERLEQAGSFEPTGEGWCEVGEAVTWLTIFVLAAFVGVEVISKVSATLHTPLMSGANAIHGVILVGAIAVAGTAEDPVVLGLSLIAVLLATINMVGGFVVTDRMLQMFSRRPAPRAVGSTPNAAGASRPSTAGTGQHTGSSIDPTARPSATTDPPSTGGPGP